MRDQYKTKIQCQQKRSNAPFDATQCYAPEPKPALAAASGSRILKERFPKMPWMIWPAKIGWATLKIAMAETKVVVNESMLAAGLVRWKTC